jgi:hypothetical protein
VGTGRTQRSFRAFSAAHASNPRHVERAFRTIRLTAHAAYIRNIYRSVRTGFAHAYIIHAADPRRIPVSVAARDGHAARAGRPYERHGIRAVYAAHAGHIVKRVGAGTVVPHITYAIQEEDVLTVENIVVYPAHAGYAMRSGWAILAAAEFRSDDAAYPRDVV